MHALYIVGVDGPAQSSERATAPSFYMTTIYRCHRHHRCTELFGCVPCDSAPTLRCCAHASAEAAESDRRGSAHVHPPHHREDHRVCACAHTTRPAYCGTAGQQARECFSPFVEVEPAGARRSTVGLSSRVDCTATTVVVPMHHKQSSAVINCAQLFAAQSIRTHRTSPSGSSRAESRRCWSACLGYRLSPPSLTASH